MDLRLLEDAELGVGSSLAGESTTRARKTDSETLRVMAWILLH